MTWMGHALRSAFGVVWRHRWTYAVPVATLLLPATLYAVNQPDMFRARAVVFVRPMDTGSVGGALPQERAAQTHELVQTSRDRLLTSANAAPVIPILLPGYAPTDPRALATIKARIQWDRAGDSAFAVSLDDTQAQRSADAVNAMLRAFQESERQVKLSGADGLRRSHEGLLATVRAEYEGVLRRLDEFRASHADSLPEQEATISSELALLRSEIASQENAAASARQRVQFLSEQITRWGAAAAEPAGRRSSAEEDQLESQLKEQQKAADDVRKRLIEERSLRTDRHPDVQKLQRQYDVLLQDVQATVSALNAARKSAQAASSKEHQQQSRGAVDDMKAMRKQTEDEEARYVAAAQEQRERVKTLQARLSTIPGLKPEYQKLVRDADEVSRRVEQAEARVANARAVTEHLRAAPANEITGYRVEEWAVAPVLPSGPARWKYLAIAVGAGLLIGYGARTLRSKYEVATLQEPRELRELLPGALVVTVPLLGDGAMRKRRVGLRDVALGLWVVAAVGSSAFAYAASKGIVSAPSWLKPIVGGRA